MNLNELTALLSQELERWLELAVTNLPNAVVAAALAVLFGLLSRPVSRSASALAKRMGAATTIVALCGSLARIAVAGVGIMLALSVLGLDQAVYSLLAGAGVVGLALGFAFQDLASNLISGIVMGFRRPFKLGDHVESEGYEGIVERMNLRTTLLRTFAGQMVVIPNREVFQNPLVNYSTTGARRVELEFGVAYGSDLEQVERVAKEALEALDGFDRERGVKVLCTGFGDSAIDFRAQLWIDLEGRLGYLDARHAALRALDSALAEAQIEIPYPTRTLVLAPAWPAADEDAVGAVADERTDTKRSSDPRSGAQAANGSVWRETLSRQLEPSRSE